MTAAGKVAIRVKQSTLAKHPRVGAKKVHNAPKVRKSLSPGTVAIMLTGPYMGRRVVVLKALDSGFVVVAGPYSVNHVPLRRAHPKRLIATSTKLDVAAVDLSALNDAIFKKPATEKQPKTITEQKGGKKERQPRSEELKALSTKIDAALAVAVKKVPLLDQYLKAKFSLTGTFNLAPHELKF